jgi:hypothetical protein
MDGLDAEQGNHSFHYYPSMPPLDWLIILALYLYSEQIEWHLRLIRDSIGWIFKQSDSNLICWHLALPLS